MNIYEFKAMERGEYTLVVRNNSSNELMYPGM